MNKFHFEVSDDSGFLALIDPDAYRSFVNEDWTLDELMAHFKNQMQQQRMLIWGTGAEKIWQVELRFSTGRQLGYRNVDGPLVVTNNRLLLTNYDELTMAAQFQDVILPEPPQEDRIIPISTGMYQCRIVQTNDPTTERPSRTSPVCDFVIEIVSRTAELPVWAAVAWAAA